MKKFENAKERFKYFLSLQGCSKNLFYEKSGMANGLLDKNGGLSEDSILKICEVYPELSIDWLLLEKGEIVREETAKTVAMAMGPQSIANNGDLKNEVSQEFLTLLASQQETIATLSRTIESLTSKK